VTTPGTHSPLTQADLVPESPWSGRSIADVFAAAAAQHADRVAVEDEGGQVSYAVLRDHVARIAGALRARVSAPNQHIALLVEPGAASSAAMLAVLSAGHACVPLDPADPQARLEFILRDSRAALVLAGAEHVGAAETLAAGTCPLLRIDDAASHAPLEPGASRAVDAERTALLIYTSGSTGQPKGVLQTHRNLLHYVWQYSTFLRLSPDDRLSMLYTLSFSASSMDIYGALLNGATLCFLNVRQRGAARLAGWIDEQRITVLHTVPTLFRHLLEHGDATATFASLRAIDLGGEPVGARDVALARARFRPDCMLVNHLAATELSVIAQQELSRAGNRPGAMPAGRPAPGVIVRVLDETGALVAPGEAGEIAIHSPFLSPGYWQQPELTASVFSDDPDRPGWRIYRSGDMGSMTADGVLSALGRKDAVVKVRGHSVHMAEVEAALRQVSGIEEVAVVAAPAVGGPPAQDPRLVAYVASPSIDVAALRRSALQVLPRYACPAEFHVLESLPRTASGKIDRRTLTLMERQTAAPSGSIADSPTDPLEQTVAGFVARVLNLPVVGRSDDFFELGGDSLQLVELQVALEGCSGRELSPQDLLRHSTVAEMAALLRRRMAASNAPGALLVPVRESGSLTPLFLVHGGSGRAVVTPRFLEAFGADQPIYAFSARGLDGCDAPHRRITDMAADYIALMRRVQPEGPYYLGSACAGALVAHEMACQLRDAGQEIAPLLLIDPPRPPRHQGLPRFLVKLSSLWVASTMARISWTRSILRGFRRMLVPQTEGAPSPASSPWPDSHIRVWIRFRMAAYGHRLRVYGGPAHVIGSRARVAHFRAGAWSAHLTGDVQLHEVAVAHHDVFDPENAEAVEQLSGAARAAQASLAERSGGSRDRWEAMWSRDDFAAPWLGRGVSTEIAEGVGSGWLPTGGTALDVGCGEGDVAGWLAEHGFPSVGVDIAPAAIERAREKFPERPGALEFHALDICSELPPDRGYQILVDRGCFHQLTADEIPRYVDTLTRVSRPTARLLLFVKAFRRGRPIGDLEERAAVVRHVEQSLGRAFAVDHVAETFLDAFNGRDKARALPGLVFWMTRVDR
jgi:amino acid adenylation domain-containing protein